MGSTDLLKRSKKDRKDLIQYINLQLASLGQPLFNDDSDSKTKFANAKFQALTEGLISSFREKTRLLSGHLSPVDSRIQNFMDDYLKEVECSKDYRLPTDTLVLNQKGMARELSLPPNGNEFKSELLNSYRLKQGILNNPSKDKRTTKGTFHIVRGGLPVPLDKKEVPKITFAHLLHEALNPTDDLKLLPFTSNQEEKAKVLVSLLLRPLVCPEVKGVISEKSMEVRFFAPGSLVSNLDFVETIFGNAGDHNLAVNDAALDEHWTGHTGCIILAPHLTKLKKKDIGLPHYDDASERQRRDGMCWKDENELYNGGSAFKLTCRDERGVVITLIADNYYGYSKKEIKTQISYSANLYGLVEEEHAGGAIAFPRGNMSDRLYGATFTRKFAKPYSFKELKKLLGDRIELQEGNYAIDKKYRDVIYIPENADIDINKNSVSWDYNKKEYSLNLSPDKVYVHPTGHKFQLVKHPTQQMWRIVDTAPEGIFCHKPSTVSGGGKSEISKSMQNAIKYGYFYIENLEDAEDKVDWIINYDYSHRWKNIRKDADPSRPFLSPRRTLGSAVKLLTPSDQYNDEYNKLLREIPENIRTLAFFVKRHFREHENEDFNWKEYFNVEIVNGRPGNILRYKHEPITASYVRIGFNEEGRWYVHKLRSDFIPSLKIQTEDDISASITLPADKLKNLNEEYKNPSLKLLTNCESHFFQRPDEAVIRGYDKDAELDIVSDGTFLTNYEPLKKCVARDLIDNAISFEKYTQPVKDFIRKVAENEKDIYFVAPSHTRIVDGKPTNNPRYLQKNIFKGETQDTYLAEVGVRLFRKIKPEDPVMFPVNAVLPGRRNNPVDKKAGFRPLSVYNPIHYQELPELFMDFVCSITGKSPSTTGAGSEGALTKGPFNMLVPTTDLNNALLSYILTEYQGFSSAAGYIGSENRFDHDISILIPEIWARLEPADRDPKLLIENDCLEKLEDFEYKGQKVLASRLGYRITENFAFRCMNRLFDEPLAVFNEHMLKPELQGMDDYVDGINNIVEAMQRVALPYFEDGSVDSAIPPLKVLLNIMAYGHFEGKDISDPELRNLFKRDVVLKSDWYKERLKLKQDRDIAFLEKQVAYLEEFKTIPENVNLIEEMDIDGRLKKAKQNLKYVTSKQFIIDITGTIGADPLFKK